MAQRRVPEGQTQSMASQCRLNHVEADESVTVAIAHAGDRGHGPFTEPAHEKAVGIDAVQGLQIVQSGVPAFSCSPAEGGGQVAAGHAANLVRSK
ncbi:hypothetical protein D9M68_949080 [compost metagenome]